jgi:hypothetical protein
MRREREHAIGVMQDLKRHGVRILPGDAAVASTTALVASPTPMRQSCAIR